MLSNKFMIISVFASLAATFLSAIALISTSTASDVLTDLSWAHGESSAFGFSSWVYVGVWGLGFQETTANDDQKLRQMRYTDSQCTQDFCHTCHKDMPIVIGFLAAFCFLSIFSVCTNFARFREDGNTSGHRSTGIGTSILAIGCGVVSLVLFATRCLKQIEDYFPNAYDWYYGTSWDLLIAAVCVKVIDILFNMLVGVAAVIGCC